MLYRANRVAILEIAGAAIARSLKGIKDAEKEVLADVNQIRARRRFWAKRPLTMEELCATRVLDPNEMQCDERVLQAHHENHMAQAFYDKMKQQGGVLSEDDVLALQRARGGAEISVRLDLRPI